MIVIGIVRMSIYYYMFNINITSFLDITEIIQLQIGFFLPAVAAIVVAYGLAAPKFRRFFNKISDALGKADNTIDSMELSEEEKIIYKNISREYKESASDMYLALVTSAIMVGGIIGVVISFKSAYDIKHGESINEVTMVVDGKPVKTDADNMFVGRTKNFIFFYNIHTKESKIYSNNDVKNLTYSKGNEYIRVSQKFIDSMRVAIPPR